MKVSANREYELKLMLSEDEYKRLDGRFEGEKFTQVNHYFDTPGMDLYKNKTMVRLRQRDGESEITVKVRNGKETPKGALDMLERTIRIDGTEAGMILEGRISIANYLAAFEDIQASGIINVGRLVTRRKPVGLSDGMPPAELDENSYLGKTDHELEWEIDEKNYDSAAGILEGLGIPIGGRSTGMSKYGRLVNELLKGKG